MKQLRMIELMEKTFESASRGVVLAESQERKIITGTIDHANVYKQILENIQLLHEELNRPETETGE